MNTNFCENTASCISIRMNIHVILNNDRPCFLDIVRSSLDALEKTPTGKRLIEKIGTASHPIFIKHGERMCCEQIHNEGGILDNKGFSSVISYNGSGSSKYLSVDCLSAVQPSFVTLAHELIHAYHNSTGKRISKSTRSDPLVWGSDEEYYTINGWESKNPERKIPKVTENAILVELGLPERFSHATLELLEKDPVSYERVKLLAEIYKSFCSKQAQKLPPPLINCAPENLSPSRRVALLYQYVFPVMFTSFGKSFDNNPLRLDTKNNNTNKSEEKITEEVNDSLFAYGDLTAQSFLFLLPIEEFCPDKFVKSSIDVETCPSTFQLKNISSRFTDMPLEVKSMYLCRLSEREVEAFDRGSDQ